MSKKAFGITFDPKMQPGHTTRNLSIGGLAGGQIDQSYSKLSTGLMDKRNLREVFKSGQDPRLLPSHYLRVKGKLPGGI